MAQDPSNTLPFLAPDGKVRLIPSNQRDAALRAGGKQVVKMLDPKGTARWIPETEKEAALKAGGKLASAPAAPSASAAPAAPSANATTPASPAPVAPLTQQLPGRQEGTYSLVDKTGHTISIPYSRVPEARQQGYHFADDHTLHTYARDFSADPQHVGHIAHWLQTQPITNPAANAGRILAGAGGELENLAVGVEKTGRRVSNVERRALGLPSVESTMPEIERRGLENLELNAAEQPVTGGLEEAGRVGEQVGELAVVPEVELPAAAAEASLLTRAGLIAARTGLSTARGAVEQAGQTLLHGGTGQETEEGAKAGALAGATAPAVVAAGRFAADVGRHFAQVGEIQTGKLVRETQKANLVIAEKAKRVRAVNQTKLADYQKAIDEAEAKAAAVGATAAEKEAAQQAQKEAEAAAARLRHDNELIEQERLAAKRALLSRQQITLQTRLAQRVQTLQKAAQSFFQRNYADIERKVGSRTVPWEELAEAVHDAKPAIEGSEESIKPFNDIIRKTKRLAEMEEAEGLEGLSAEELADLAPDERARLAEHQAESAEGGLAAGASFADLKGYYSEAGRLLASPSTPGDVKQALVKFRDLVDGMQQRLADEAGVGSRYKLLRNQYKSYAEGWLDYQGPNKSGSRVALALKGEDVHNQTKPLADKSLTGPELSRIKQILAGKGDDAATQFIDGEIQLQGGKREPAGRYRRDTTKLLDNLRETQRQLEGLPKPKAVTPLEEGAAVATGSPAAPKTPKTVKSPRLLTVPKEKTISPSRLSELRAENLHRRASILNHFGTYVATSGLVGGITALALPGRTDPATAAAHAAEGLMVGAVSPYILAKILEKPGVVAALSKPTRKDLQALMKLPPSARPEVEETLRRLSQEAQRKGLIKTMPWIRILSGEAGRSLSNPAQPTAHAAGRFAEGQMMPLPAAQPAAAPMPLGGSQ